MGGINMKKFNVNWIVNIDKKTKLKVTGNAIYTGKFSKNEISYINLAFSVDSDPVWWYNI